jgi:RecJ-like exonuclease
MLFCFECKGHGRVLNHSEDLEICPKCGGLGFIKKEKNPDRKGTVSLSLIINDKKTDSDCQLYEIRNVLIKLHLQNFFEFPCPSKGLCVPIF